MVLVAAAMARVAAARAVAATAWVEVETHSQHSLLTLTTHSHYSLSLPTLTAHSHHALSLITLTTHSHCSRSPLTAHSHRSQLTQTACSCDSAVLVCSCAVADSPIELAARSHRSGAPCRSPRQARSRSLWACLAHSPRGKGHRCSCSLLPSCNHQRNRRLWRVAPAGSGTRSLSPQRIGPHATYRN